MSDPAAQSLASILDRLFGPLEPAALHELHSQLEWLHLTAGTPLFRQGDPGDALYIVVSGRLRVEQADAAGNTRGVSEIGRGECVGEFALLTRETRSASVYAIRDSSVAKISQALFERMVQRHPQAMTQLARFIVQRVRANERGATISTSASAFVVLPTGPAAPADRFARELADALAAHGPALFLSSAECDRMLSQAGAAQAGDDQPASRALAGWLSEQEAQHRYVVYAADHEWTPWTRRCLRQADRLLLLGKAGSSPALGQAEAAARAANGQIRAELVLLHEPGTSQPSGTQAWLAARQLAGHQHVQQGNPADMARLARRLTGRAVGVVLSGGGARGQAHIGAMRALEEAGLQADYIGGTSIGALIGALYAAGYQYEQLAQLAGSVATRKRLLDPTLPIAAFNRTRKLTALYRELFGELRIEDLWRRFFCVSSNLTRAEPVIHETGLLWAAIRASTAIPVIFAPVLHHTGDVLIDGGILNNFPIDLMRTRCEAGMVIGVDVAPPTDKLNNYRFGTSISGWQLLWNRVKPFGRRDHAPSLFENLVRTIEINSAYRVRSPAFRRHADLLIQMPDRPFGRLAFDIHAEMIELGYRETKRQIQAWQAGMR